MYEASACKNKTSLEISILDILGADQQTWESL
jgi:hypothetical protein